MKVEFKHKKSLGQNFLINKEISRKMCFLKDFKNQEIVEVGPGKVLQTLCKRIDSTLSISGVESNHQINELTNV